MSYLVEFQEVLKLRKIPAESNQTYFKERRKFSIKRVDKGQITDWRFERYSPLVLMKGQRSKRHFRNLIEKSRRTANVRVEFEPYKLVWYQIAMSHFPTWNCGWWVGLLIWRSRLQTLALSSYRFFGQETSLKVFSIHPGVWIVTGDLLQGPTVRWNGIASICFMKRITG